MDWRSGWIGADSLQPSAFGLPAQLGSGNTSSSEGQGGSGRDGKNERRSLAASPLSAGLLPRAPQVLGTDVQVAAIYRYTEWHRYTQ